MSRSITVRFTEAEARALREAAADTLASEARSEAVLGSSASVSAGLRATSRLTHALMDLGDGFDGEQWDATP